MERLIFSIFLFFLFYQTGVSVGVDSIQWIKMPVKTYPDYPVQIQQIDSINFYRQKCPFSSYETSAPVKKKGKTIRVRCENKTIKFKDSGDDECDNRYFVYGSYKSWIIIKGFLYCHYEQYYMINIETGSIDSLADEPLFYGDKILCIEGDNTDGTKMVEVWQIDEKKISLMYSADLKRRRFFSIDDFFLNEGIVFLKYDGDYFKLFYDTPKN